MADNLLSAYSYPPSEYTTADEMRQERVSQGLGWDTSRPGREFIRRAVTMLPLAIAPGVGRVIPGTPMTLPEIMRRPPPQVTPRAVRSGGPTQGQRDLYELTPATDPREARAMMEDLNHRSMLDPVRSQRYWDAPDLHSAVPSSVPRSNAPQRGPTQAQRDYHSLPPYAMEDVAMSPPGPWYYDPTRVRAFHEGIRDFEQMARPPRNRMNALLPFAGLGAFPPDEQY